MSLKKSAIAFIGVAAIGSFTQAAILLPAPITLTVGSGTSIATALTVTPNDFPSATPTNNLTTSVSLNTAASPLDAIYNGTNSLGTTEYAVTATVINATTTTLTGYAFELGTGTGSTFTPTIAANIPSFYGINPAPTSNDFTTNNVSADVLTYSGGSIAPSGMGIFTFNLAVPDTVTGALPAFTLRELPTAIPEPASIALLGAVGLLAARRRYRNA